MIVHNFDHIQEFMEQIFLSLCHGDTLKTKSGNCLHWALNQRIHEKKFNDNIHLSIVKDSKIDYEHRFYIQTIFLKSKYGEYTSSVIHVDSFSLKKILMEIALQKIPFEIC